MQRFIIVNPDFYLFKMSIDKLYKIFFEQLKTIYDERESINITDWVFESITSIKRLDRIINKHQQLSDSNVEQLQICLAQLLTHKPVQYVLGEAWFYKMKLRVNEHVLIPRPETEELVEWVVEEIRNKKAETRDNKRQELTSGSYQGHNPQLTILEIGAGTGCISIALKKELLGAEIIAIEISEQALQVAKQNAADHNTSIQFWQLDFLNETLWDTLGSFDILISNPPYIPVNEKSKLSENVVNYEPHLALFVSDNDPFIFYKKIACFAERHLKDEGKIFVEVHESYAEDVQQIFNQKGFKTQNKKDIYGRDRMVKAYK